MKKNCWISICCFLVLSLLLTGCDGTQKTDNVDMVKQGYLGLYTDMTVQQLLHRHYGMLYQEETWNGGTTNKGEDLVEVRYTDPSGTFEDTRIQFKTDGTCFWVSAFSDPMEPIEESTDLMATLNYLYLEAYLQENYEQSQDEAFLQELIQKLDQIPASAVLYGAAAGYTGDRAQICRVFGEEPIDISAAWLLDSQGLLDMGAYAADDTLDPYTADELLQELSSNALRAQKTFLNQYIELTGKITSFDSSGAYFVLGPTGDTYYATPITCIISDETLLDKILEANIGDVATIRCQVTDVGEFMGYSVELLDIVEVSQPTKPVTQAGSSQHRTFDEDQEYLIQQMDEQVSTLSWYDDELTNPFFYGDIYLEITAYCGTDNNPIYYLNYRAGGAEFLCIPNAENVYFDGGHRITFYLGDYFSSYDGVIEVVCWYGSPNEYMLNADIENDNCVDTGGEYAYVRNLNE